MTTSTRMTDEEFVSFPERHSVTEEQLRAHDKQPQPHNKRVLTCKNHRHLRWSTKREAGRTLYYLGQAFDPPRYHADFSGLVCREQELIEGKVRGIHECPCPPSDLIPAPEDKILNPDLYPEE